jgi:hypothetical protein
MMIHHPDRGTFPSIETLITGQVGQFWKAHPGRFSKAPKNDGFASFLDKCPAGISEVDGLMISLEEAKS